MVKSGITVLKASGEREEFSEAKYKKSLRRSGASEDAINAALNEVKKTFDGIISTEELYGETLKVLKNKQRPAASRYNLKHGLFELGPSGFPFEKFVGTLFKEQGYGIEVGTEIVGNCVKHEVDVIARRENIHTLVECKFHNKRGTYTSIKVPLYVNSRFDDLNECAKKGKKGSCHFNEGYIFTNTRFSSDSIQYSSCKGLKLIGWSFPNGKGLAHLIDTLGVHPVTCLTELSEKEARRLVQEGVVTCKDLPDNMGVLRKMGISGEKANSVVQEAMEICKLKD